MKKFRLVRNGLGKYIVESEMLLSDGSHIDMWQSVSRKYDTESEGRAALLSLRELERQRELEVQIEVIEE